MFKFKFIRFNSNSETINEVTVRTLMTNSIKTSHEIEWIKLTTIQIIVPISRG